MIELATGCDFFYICFFEIANPTVRENSTDIYNTRWSNSLTYLLSNTTVDVNIFDSPLQILSYFCIFIHKQNFHILVYLE